MTIRAILMLAVLGGLVTPVAGCIGTPEEPIPPEASAIVESQTSCSSASARSECVKIVPAPER